MIKKVKEWVKGIQNRQKQKIQLKQMQKYYTVLRQGATFIKYIQQDLADQQNKMNRHQRRRMQKSLVKGEITPEIVNYYASKIDIILAQIDTQLNPPRAGQVRINGKRL